MSVIANTLSIIRIFCGILLIFRMNITIMLIGCFTDFFDGYIARKFNNTSVFGAQLDHIADKIFCYCIFSNLYHSEVPVLTPTLMLFIRDIYICFLRTKKNLPTTFIGKSKTAIIMISLITLAMEYTDMGLILLMLGVILGWVDIALILAQW